MPYLILYLLWQVLPEVTPAEIVVDTEPGAKVYLDERLAGEANRGGRLVISRPKPGSHTIEVRSTYKKPFTAQITVLPGKTSRVLAKLGEFTGDLEILSIPEATVHIDGKLAGVTDSNGRLQVRSLAAAERSIVEHKVRVSRDGYNVEERTLSVDPDSVTTVTIDLQRVEAPVAASSVIPEYQFQRRLKAHKNNPPSISFSADSRQILTAGDDQVMMWNTETGRLLLKASVPWVYSRSGISQDHRWLVVPFPSKGAIHVLDARTGNLARQLESHPKVAIASLSPDGKRVYSVAPGETATTAKLWDFETGQLLRTWQGGTGRVAFSRDSLWLAEATHSQAVVLTDLASGKLTRSFKLDSLADELAFSPDGRWLAVITYRAVELFEASTGKVGPRLLFPDGAPSDIAFTPDSRFLAGADSDIFLWEIAAAGKVRRFKVPVTDIRTVAVSPDGRWIAGGSTGYLTLLRLVE